MKIERGNDSYLRLCLASNEIIDFFGCHSISDSDAERMWKLVRMDDDNCVSVVMDILKVNKIIRANS